MTLKEKPASAKTDQVTGLVAPGLGPTLGDEWDVPMLLEAMGFDPATVPCREEFEECRVALNGGPEYAVLGREIYRDPVIAFCACVAAQIAVGVVCCDIYLPTDLADFLIEEREHQGWRWNYCRYDDITRIEWRTEGNSRTHCGTAPPHWPKWARRMIE